MYFNFNFVDLTASGFVKSVFVESGVLSSLVSDANAAAAVLQHDHTFGAQWCTVPRGPIGGKTGKTAVLPGFCKIECGSGRGLIFLGRVHWAGGAPGHYAYVAYIVCAP